MAMRKSLWPWLLLSLMLYSGLWLTWKKYHLPSVVLHTTTVLGDTNPNNSEALIIKNDPSWKIQHEVEQFVPFKLIIQRKYLPNMFIPDRPALSGDCLVFQIYDVKADDPLLFSYDARFRIVKCPPVTDTP